MPESAQPQREQVARESPDSTASAARAVPRGGTGDPSAANGSSGAGIEVLPGGRWRGRWKRRLGIGLVVVVVLFGVLVGFAPAIASMPAVYNVMLSFANGRMRGTMRVEGLSLSWGGPIEVRGLRVDDSEKRQVLQAARVTAEVGVWRLVTSAMSSGSAVSLGEVTVESPQVVVHEQRGGRITVVDAFGPREAAGESSGGQGSAGELSAGTPGAGSAGQAPAVQGRMIINDGVVKVVREGAGSYEVTDFDGRVELKSLGELEGKVELTLSDGAKVVGETSLRQLVSQGEWGAQNATGTLRLKSDRAVKIGPLAALAGQAGLDGGVTLAVDAAIDAGKLDGRITVGVAGLQSSQRSAANASPINADIQGQIRWADQKLAADVTLAGDAGSARAKVAYQSSGKAANFDADQIVSAVLNGRALTWPDLTVDAQASLDLARLGRAVPELLKVREGVELTGGKLEITKLAIAGGSKPAASAAISLREVAGRRGESPIRLEPIAINLDSTLDEGKGLQVRRLELLSSFAQVKANGFVRELRATMKADVGQLRRELAQVFDVGAAELAGRVSMSANGAAEGELFALAGQGEIEELVVGTGPSTVREARIQFAYDAKLDQAKKSVSIGKCRLASKPLTAEVIGTIAQYDGACQLDLKGHYSASWEGITGLLHQWAPATADTVIVAGTSTSEFRVTGAARQAGAKPEFRGVSSGVSVAWGSAELYGVRMGAAKLAPVLKDGQVTLPKTVIPAADGKVNLGAVIDFQAPDPTLRMPGQTALLENVAITKELGDQLLGRINPVFQHLSSIEGRIKLGVRDVVAPLGETVKRRGAGKGRLDLSRVKMQPGGLMAELLSLGGMKANTAYPVEIGALDFVMKDGRILYDNFSLAFPGEFDLKFRGSVGLDETLDLVVSVPVRAALLDKLGVKGPTLEYARMLGGTRVDIPIVGTRENPRIDFSKVDVQSLMKDVLLKAEPGKRIEDLLKGLQGDKGKKP